MNNLDIFQQMNDIWSSRFNVTIICVSALLVVFGLLPPIVATLLQRRDLEKEREHLNKEMAEKFAELYKQRELIAQHNLQINKLQELTSNAYIALANYYLDELLRSVTKLSDPAKTDEQKQSDMQRTLIYFGDALHCLVNSKNREWLVKIMDLTADPISVIIMRDTALLKKAADGLRQNNPLNNFFVTRENLAEIAGAENSVYKKFVSAFQPLFELVDLYYPGEYKEKTDRV